MVITADGNGQIDSAYHTLVKHINSPIPIVMVSWCENFVFNEALLNIGDYVLIDFCEYGWDTDLTKTDSHIWGEVNNSRFQRYYNGDWILFDNWINNNPPKLILKRELLKRDVTDKIKPIEYPCVIDEWIVEPKEVFDERELNVVQYWGRSNENRMRIHGEIWLHAYEKGFQVCDNIYFINNYLQEEKGEKWITLWMPHWARIDINQIMILNGMSKLSLSWAGAGFKCFRTGESPVNSVMVMHKNEYAWEYDWDETNCILVEHGKEIEGIERALQNENLYDIYVKGMENVNKYRLPNYTKHIEATINNAL